MPQNESFFNPYRMLLRPGDGPDRRYEANISDLKGWTGFFSCELIAFSPFETKRASRKEWSKPFSEPPVVVPGTSLKGVIRSVAEFVAPGCFGVTGAKQVTSNRNWQTCSPKQGGVCVTCAMFGTLAPGAALRGRVRIGDAAPEAPDQAPAFREPVFIYSGTPAANRHKPFYPDGPYQKFYHHQPGREDSPLTVPRGTRNAVDLHPVARGSRFRFRVQFEGLDDRQLALLDYALALQPGLLHKMGRGKPHGLGSVQVRIVERRVQRGEDRWRPSSGAALTGELPRSCAELRQELEQREDLDELRRMLWWREGSGFFCDYPGFQWFRAHGSTPLRTVAEVIPEPYEPMELEPPEVGQTTRREGSIDAEETEITHDGCRLVLTQPGAGELEAQDQAGNVLGRATDQDRSLRAGLPEAQQKKLKKKKVLNGVRVTIKEQGNKQQIVSIELSEG